MSLEDKRDIRRESGKFCEQWVPIYLGYRTSMNSSKRKNMKAKQHAWITQIQTNPLDLKVYGEDPQGRD